MRWTATGRRWRRRGLGLSAALALVLALAGRLVLGAPAAPSAAPVPLAVAVRSDWPDLSPGVVRRAIEDELQSWVVSVDPGAPVPA